MKFLKLFSWLSLLAPSVFAAGETLGEYMINHIADSRGEWHPFPYVHVPIDWTFELFGINFAPSLHVMMMILAILVLVPLMVKAAKRKNNAPVSRWGHAIESVVKFLHDDLVVPNVGKKIRKNMDAFRLHFVFLYFEFKYFWFGTWSFYSYS
jgi:F0F1-type ATP synthase membrane subunit a